MNLAVLVIVDKFLLGLADVAALIYESVKVLISYSIMPRSFSLQVYAIAEVSLVILLLVLLVVCVLLIGVVLLNVIVYIRLLFILIFVLFVQLDSYV